MKKIHCILSVFVLLIFCLSFSFADVIQDGIPARITGIKTFISGIVIKDPNTISLDPNGGGRFKCLATDTAVDPNTPLLIDKSGIAATSTNGIVLQNSTASTVGVPVQYSPALTFKGSAWDTDGGNDVWDWKIVNSSTSGGNTYTNLSFYSYKNGSLVPSTGLSMYSTGQVSGLWFKSTFLFSNQITSLTTTSTDGIIAVSESAATSGVPVRISPRFRLQGKVWNTTGAGSAETSDWIMENLPVSGTTPSSLLKFGYSANGGAYSYPFVFRDNGYFGINTTTPAGIMQVVANDTGDAGIGYQIFDTYRNGTGGGGIQIRKARGSLSSPAAVQSGDTLGILFWNAYNQSSYFSSAASILTKVDGSITDSTKVPGKLEFNTTTVGASSPSTKMTIYNSGNIEASPDTDTTFTFGRGMMGYVSASYPDNFVLAHYDNFTDTKFALRQDSSGATVLNGNTYLYFQTTGNIVGYMTSSGLTMSAGKTIASSNIEPITDDTYYLGKNNDDSPLAYKGVVLKDTANGKYYRIEVTNGTITATDLTD